MRKSILTVGLLCLLLSPAASLGQTDDASTKEKEAPEIGIVYTAPIDVINDIIGGFKGVVRDSFPNATFIEKHASGEKTKYESKVLSTISERPDLLAPITTPITRIAVQQARGNFPIVFMGVTDPVGAGVANSLKQPGKATGSSDVCPFSELLGIVRTVLPNAKTLGLPYNPTDQPAVFSRKQLEKLAPKHGFKLVTRQVTSASALPTKVRGVARNADAIIISLDNLMMENPASVTNAAQSVGKPTFACDVASVQKGAVAGVSVNYRKVGVLAGERAVRVLQGENPGDIPVGVLESGGIALNHRAASQLDLDFKDKLVARADTNFYPNYESQQQAIDISNWSSYIWGLLALVVIGGGIWVLRR